MNSYLDEFERTYMLFACLRYSVPFENSHLYRYREVMNVCEALPFRPKLVTQRFFSVPH